MDAITPFLLFNGNAGEALDFYVKALDGKLLMKSTFGEAPVPSTDDMKDKIMHGSMQAGKLAIMVSDCPPDKAANNGNNVQLSLNFSDTESLDKTFKALSDGATIIMGLQDTFWGARFGMLIDKFGINWMFNHDYKKEEVK